MNRSILIIGVGNPYRCDDSAGLSVLKLLHKYNLNNVHLMERSGEGSDIMEIWKEHNFVIIVDAVQSNAKPGTIHRIDALQNEVPTDFFHYSTHAFGMAEAVEMARMLDELPAHLLIYGIEGKLFKIGKDISPEVQEAIETVINEILEKIKEIQMQELEHA